MKIPAEHTSVLIIGAGPSGLMMAAQLLRNGIQPVIIDSKKGPTEQSKALAVQARSLEIYRQLGVVDRVLHDGKKAGGVLLNQDGQRVASLLLDDMGEPQTLYPYILMYEQSKNERLLLDYLTQNCCPVYWDTALISFRQKESRFEVLLKTGADQLYITCDWLIGADGAHSTVRKELEISFKGDTYANEFYLADVTLANLNDSNLHLHLSKQGFAAFFPMPEENRYRIVGSLSPQLLAKQNLTIDDVRPHLSGVVRKPVNITEAHWFTTYRLHHRMAQRFRAQRAFLIGDAAHIHSPVGGQGMNTGLQDAYNLAWKLAGVINLQYNAVILDSYAAERMPVAKGLLKTTDRAFTFIVSDGFLNQIIKKWVLPGIIRKLWSSPKLRQAFFKRISQTHISYAESKINLHLSQGTKIIAGDRLPCLKVYDEKKQIDTDLHEWCAKPGFTFIAIGKQTEDELFRLAKWITQNYPNILNFFYLPPTQKNRHVFDAFEMGASQQKTLIVRPDMYIGFINDSVDVAKIDNYLITVAGVVKVV
ncbi:2-polyprenyl-6-methoxyphenol hydroxylase-like FAD-dependent oxidoreductase [Mucilaginibacter gracilis]|uniref:2-polyprenyl-6-methoxyphenol hydroxylase-like FAD-dependent oxidoreductase n=1 Tax=Mucilaginibacter gracilis TaxID=423350 RepID=A0A495IWX7_9SPHI|nr:FAD-dependent monooxygenase [Mucilaginibacter gracilis]RKR80861.1 2-polyprenyl-6-methoxyphenol hydroxylase-like FAD-dependent oxidoreductase [Mucilaginibacter gracilis]